MSSALKKLLITPWFGPLPVWMPRYRQSIERLSEHGFDWLPIHSLPWFATLVRSTLGIECPVMDARKISDYRAAFGEIFAEEIAGYDFWGHTDYDCVYGRVDAFVSDAFLDTVDLHSDHPSYVCGPWALYRTGTPLASAFREEPEWREILCDPDTIGWVETTYTGIVNSLPIRRSYTLWHAYEEASLARLRLEDGKLLDGEREVMMAHFRRTKRWPLP